MSEIRAILFDKDGTLLDFDATWSVFVQQLTLEAAGGETAEAARLLAMIGFDSQISRFRAGSLFGAGTNAEVVAALWPGLDEAQLRIRIAESERRAAGAVAVALPGVVEAVRQLHGDGLRLGIATNDSSQGAARMLETLGIAELFDVVLGYDSVSQPKPAPDVVHAFAAATGLRPSQIAMVGDNLHDLHAARAGGAALAVGVLTGNSQREDLATHADIILDSVAELPAMLRCAADSA